MDVGSVGPASSLKMPDFPRAVRPCRADAHGLRKAGAVRFAEHGCTEHEIAAFGGWKSIREVQRYSRMEDRRQLALRAAAKLKPRTEVANLETRLANGGKKS